MKKIPFVLIILDGFGYREAPEHNPTRTTPTPTIDRLYAENPYVLIEASGEAVGLPKGQMGNSEVGHLHIGAGRKVPQDLVRINQAIQQGDFFNNTIIVDAIQTAQKNDKAVHVIGLLSDGGVHSHVDHIEALLKCIHQNGVTKNYLHAITDGRDTPPQSARAQLERINTLGFGKIISLCGRYYAMDRDQRWDRTQLCYDLLTQNIAAFQSNNALTALEAAYARGEKDEFILPTIVGEPIAIQDGDVIIFANFRADRARQLTHAFMDENFTAFVRTKKIALSAYVTLTEYYEEAQIKVAFPPFSLHNTLGEYLASKGLTQLRLAETEKYAHVTYFMNGGIETPNKGESRQLIPSPKIATYDLQPEMSAIAVTDALTFAIESGEYDVIICNYANPDMIGHTGNVIAAEQAMIVIDACLARVLIALKKVSGEALITADHGNIECMYDGKTNQPHTAHTQNLVPLIYVGRPATVSAITEVTGALDDVAPTLLYLMGLEKPVEMTGHHLFELGTRSLQ
ncbi:MAG: 2,3-bisphosphoglycerate-independent phosphoglycerate mutase [Coxiellaceae bacterium]|nr:2,3-bisphosphoglycerate-independent phosphoglycerate mutase [Coxiellaceae bacterium]